MLKQFNYPTTILYGFGAVDEAAKRMKDMGFRKTLLVSDYGLAKLGVVDKISDCLESCGISCVSFLDVHPNPLEEDVDKGAKVYLENKCDSLIALGGGSPMDAAKVIMIAVTHEGPLSQYDDAIGGDKLIINPLPPLVAIPTTAGTGSEVGRCGVVTMKESNNKTIFFHPTLLPRIAVLEPDLTLNLPKHLTMATGLDAFTHSLEAFLSPGFDPMADGLALESMRLVVKNLPQAIEKGDDLEARGSMMMAATMGATAFQKGLGMIHSLAHPLSSECGLHHGLANALVGPECIAFIESQKLNDDQTSRLQRVVALFTEEGRDYKSNLSEMIKDFYAELGLEFGLSHHGVKESDLKTIAKKALGDVCHKTNMVPVNEEQFLGVLKASL